MGTDWGVVSSRGLSTPLSSRCSRDTEGNLAEITHARLLYIAGRKTWCESEDDFDLLTQAVEIEKNPESVLKLTTGRLHLMKDACQRYSLGKYQRLVNLAIENGSR